MVLMCQCTYRQLIPSKLILSKHVYYWVDNKEFLHCGFSHLLHHTCLEHFKKSRIRNSLSPARGHHQIIYFNYRIFVIVSVFHSTQRMDFTVRMNIATVSAFHSSLSTVIIFAHWITVSFLGFQTTILG